MLEAMDDTPATPKPSTPPAEVTVDEPQSQGVLPKLPEIAPLPSLDVQSEANADMDISEKEPSTASTPSSLPDLVSSSVSTTTTVESEM